MLPKRYGITFQCTKTWKESTDPDFDAELDRIEQAIEHVSDWVFTFDEFGPLRPPAAELPGHRRLTKWRSDSVPETCPKRSHLRSRARAPSVTRNASWHSRPGHEQLHAGDGVPSRTSIAPAVPATQHCRH
ncbi:hypothetical protein ACFY0F_26255 [Streptomyces sp. NPDC001544]|uniref:hypothetical protein n=1 Tax=Streptomyces sp. NPDC001544 TaxID=3364584 RepID=UPI0036AB692E